MNIIKKKKTKRYKKYRPKNDIDRKEKRLEIHVKYCLRGSVDSEAMVNRIHAMHREKCPVYKSVSGCIKVTTELEFIKNNP
mgnify:CR=1 FL=1